LAQARYLGKEVATSRPGNVLFFDLGHVVAFSAEWQAGDEVREE
jgi:uncharacterized protein YfaT (DUF1175 family)